MSELSRWSIEELLARYELEPQLQDVFVEGSFDREVLTQAITVKDSSFTFYEIDVVDVPASVLAKYTLTSGNKQRAIALSKELGCLPREARVVCLIDRDLDHWFEEVQHHQRLRWSVYCSMECHFLTSNSVTDIVVTTGRAKINNFEPYLSSLLQVLRQLFALRLTDRELALSLKWVALRKYLSKVDDAVVFDAQRYLQAVLSSNKKTSRLSEFMTSYASWIERLTCDIRLAARGHDFTELLAWSIAAFGGQREFASEAAVERLFVLLARSIASISSEVQ